MATRKKKSSRASAPPRSAKLADSFATSGQKIWLAGLGAYERARKEGPKMFDLLVSQGKALRGQAAAAADQAYKNVRAQAESAGAQASGRWDKLEQVFEDRVSKAVHKLGRGRPHAPGERALRERACHERPQTREKGPKGDCEEARDEEGQEIEEDEGVGGGFNPSTQQSFVEPRGE